MSAEIINLRAYRKRRARSERESEAEANRLRFGRTKAERTKETIEQAREKRTLDGAERTGPTPVTSIRPDGTKSDP